MNIKHCFLIFLLFNSFLLSAQRTSSEGIIEIDYTQLKKGCYHGSIRLWEIIDLTSQSLTLKGYDEDDKLEIKKYFLHPKNDEFFINGERTRF